MLSPDDETPLLRAAGADLLAKIIGLGLEVAVWTGSVGEEHLGRRATSYQWFLKKKERNKTGGR